MKIFSTKGIVRVKDIFNEILFEKRNILSKKYKNREIGVMESLIRLNYSRGIFFPGACINLTSFYFNFNLFNNEKYSRYNDDLKVVIYIFVNCIISLPLKALQYQTLNNLSNESSILKDFSKLFRVGYLRRGFVSRSEFNYSNTLLYLITENMIGMTIFFHLMNKPFINHLVNSIMDESEDRSLNNKQELISEICEINPTIRRTIFLSKQDKETEKTKLTLITRELLKGIITGFLTGCGVSTNELVIKYILGEMVDFDTKRFINIVALNHKMNVLKFTLQYGLAYSFLRFYQELESKNKNKY